MNYIHQPEKITAFIGENRENFEGMLLKEAVNVAEKIRDILDKGNIDLLKNAGELVIYIVEEQEENLVAFAKKEGIAWAEHSLTLAFKLEWVQAIRRTLWKFLEKFNALSNDGELTTEDFFKLEKKINDQIDQFLNTFVISYSNYKDELIQSQRKLVEHLSVPIIPVSGSVAVLPLIGMMDSYRMHTIEEKVFNEISKIKIQTLIMDLSGIANMDFEVIVHYQKILNGISMMGCKAVITGLRAELVRKMIHAGISFENMAETKGTLQHTLREHLALASPSEHQ
ncbi:STAS domain-containing protein [Peribacillus kribbensis]|uniref:STAS domain-containing protein n=1 Tax=Peribacillus kribbensis TaxID=356658 RepID=UPI0003FC1FFE|nr:STAS domain-containing protein [Peribacillus kribbensis]